MNNEISYTGVVAMEPLRGIGLNGSLPWHLPDDLKAFKSITMGHPILMGRKTFDSIGKPLPGRQNIVLTRDLDWQADGVTVIHTLDDLKKIDLQDKEIMVLGGAEIFSLIMPQMNKMYVSFIHEHHNADTFLAPFEDRFSSRKIIEQYKGFDLVLFQ